MIGEEKKVEKEGREDQGRQHKKGRKERQGEERKAKNEVLLKFSILLFFRVQCGHCVFMEIFFSVDLLIKPSRQILLSICLKTYK